MKTVAISQVNIEFSGVTYLPLTAGFLQSFAEKHVSNPQDFKFLPPVYKRVRVEEAVSHLMGADLVGFSTYVWNRNFSLEVARRLKACKPSTIIVFGGPEVPDRSESFLRKYRFIDLACHNEGEQAFVHILEKAFSGDFTEIPSVSFIGRGERYTQTEWTPRMRDFTTMPSPYLSGVFDPLMEKFPHQKWDGLWETNRGCPFSCTFCDWGSNTKSKVIRFDLETLYAELEWFAKHKVAFIFCCDANFGIFPRDVDITRKAAEMKAKYGFPEALSVQNAKNVSARLFDAQKTLADAGMNKGVTMAFQSRSPQVLKEIERDNISSVAFQELNGRFVRAGIETYSDLIIALPAETYASFADGVSLTITEGQHNRIQFGNLSMMPNAPMAEPSYIERHGLKTVEIHASVFHGVNQEDPDGVYETEDIVVETRTLSREDWMRCRIFAWMTSFLHFDKIFQIPLVLLHETTGVSYRELIEVFTEGATDMFPTLREVREFFRTKAKSILEGGVEFCPETEWLNIFWPVDEYVFIKLCKEGRLDGFYQEATEALLEFFQRRSIKVDTELLLQAIFLNKSLIKVPFASGDVTLHLSYNILEFWQAVRRLEPIPLDAAPCSYRIDRTKEHWRNWQDWCRFVVWYGNKKGAYLYGNVKTDTEIAGHF